MKPKFVIPLLTSILISTSCNEKPDSSALKEEGVESLGLSKSKKSSAELKSDLEKLRFVLTDVSKIPDYHFSGNQSELDDFLRELLVGFPKDQFSTTWVPEPSKKDEDLKGVVQIRALPEHLNNLRDLIGEL